MKITKEMLIQAPNKKEEFVLEYIWNDKKIDLSLDPDYTSIDKTLKLANRILENFEEYLKKAENIIVKEFWDDYNEDWTDEEKGYSKLSEDEFRNKIELMAIYFLSENCIDVFFSESGMFGHHSLIAQSFDGENFTDAIMFG